MNPIAKKFELEIEAMRMSEIEAEPSDCIIQCRKSIEKIVHSGTRGNKKKMINVTKVNMVDNPVRRMNFCCSRV